MEQNLAAGHVFFSETVAGCGAKALTQRSGGAKARVLASLALEDELEGPELAVSSKELYPMRT
eukprot:5269856-Alexandrium_andersonii.AAC.1